MVILDLTFNSKNIAAIIILAVLVLLLIILIMAIRRIAQRRRKEMTFTLPDLSTVEKKKESAFNAPHADYVKPKDRLLDLEPDGFIEQTDDPEAKLSSMIDDNIKYMSSKAYEGVRPPSLPNLQEVEAAEIARTAVTDFSVDKYLKKTHDKATWDNMISEFADAEADAVDDVDNEALPSLSFFIPGKDDQPIKRPEPERQSIAEMAKDLAGNTQDEQTPQTQPALQDTQDTLVPPVPQDTQVQQVPDTEQASTQDTPADSSDTPAKSDTPKIADTPSKPKTRKKKAPKKPAKADTPAQTGEQDEGNVQDKINEPVEPSKADAQASPELKQESLVDDVKPTDTSEPTDLSNEEVEQDKVDEQAEVDETSEQTEQDKPAETYEVNELDKDNASVEQDKVDELVEPDTPDEQDKPDVVDEWGEVIKDGEIAVQTVNVDDLPEDLRFESKGVRKVNLDKRFDEDAVES